MSAALKSLVSKKRRRFQQDGYDLDLTCKFIGLLLLLINCIFYIILECDIF